jgi:hypothetical protein
MFDVSPFCPTICLTDLSKSSGRGRRLGVADGWLAGTAGVRERTVHVTVWRARLGDIKRGMSVEVRPAELAQVERIADQTLSSCA